MGSVIIDRIKDFLATHPPVSLAPNIMLSVNEIRAFGITPRACFPTISQHQITEAEVKLGFPLPSLLKAFFLEVSNGIAGFSYTIIGLGEGCRCHLGDLVQTYAAFVEDEEAEGREWTNGLLPFCSWGCNIFSCIDCSNSQNPIYCFEEGDVSRKAYGLEDFFKMWIDGVDILSYQGAGNESTEIINPFTGRTTRVTKRRRKGDAR